MPYIKKGWNPNSIGRRFKKGEFFGIISQDTDGLLFGASRLIRNLTISQKRKAQPLGQFHTSTQNIMLLLR